MAVPCSNLPTQKPFSVLLVIFTTFFLLLARKGNSQKLPVFIFTKFTPGLSKITLQGNASILADGVLALTNHENSTSNIGRALYAKPVRIWDSTTGIVASFVTSFSFIVKDIEGFKPADGIIFFLAPQGSKIPPNSSGGRLGVFDANSASNQFVGVEFDSFVNKWDPDSPHIGIDVNNVTSLKTEKWNRVSGSLVTVTIAYESLFKTLTVVVIDKNIGLTSTFSQVVDLKAVLPEKVSVGLSATTEGGRETHDIHAWSFISNLL